MIERNLRNFCFFSHCSFPCRLETKLCSRVFVNSWGQTKNKKFR